MSGGGEKELIGHHYSRFHHPHFMPFCIGLNKLGLWDFGDKSRCGVF